MRQPLPSHEVVFGIHKACKGRAGGGGGVKNSGTFGSNLCMTRVEVTIRQKESKDFREACVPVG
jgi:hypothetical protein